jgi:hypothetical protein
VTMPEEDDCNHPDLESILTYNESEYVHGHLAAANTTTNLKLYVSIDLRYVS